MSKYSRFGCSIRPFLFIFWFGLSGNQKSNLHEKQWGCGNTLPVRDQWRLLVGFKSFCGTLHFQPISGPRLALAWKVMRVWQWDLQHPSPGPGRFPRLWIYSLTCQIFPNTQIKTRELFQILSGFFRGTCSPYNVRIWNKTQHCTCIIVEVKQASAEIIVVFFQKDCH